MINKHCSSCGIAKPICDFRKSSVNKDRLRGQCKSCEGETLKTWRENNPEKYNDQKKRNVSKRKLNGNAYSREWKRKKRAENKVERIVRSPEKKKSDDLACKKRWKVNNKDLVRADAMMRRAERKGATVIDKVLPSQIFNRDSGICQICNQPIEDNKFEVDHKIPVSKGGQHTYNNLQLSHMRCNRSKGAKLIL